MDFLKKTSRDKAAGAGKSGIGEMIASRETGVVHLTHNDLDAVGADAIHRMKFGKIVSVFCSVGSFPSILGQISGIHGNGDLLSISDLGFQQQAVAPLKNLKTNGWRIEWRDHHRWKDEELRIAGEIVDLLSVDVTTCGCGLCARDLMPGDPQAAEVARVVCDYDLWKHEDPRSAVLGIVLQKRKNRDYVRDAMVKGVLSDETIEREYREISDEMEAMMEKSERRAVVMGSRYRIVLAPLYGYPSETAARLRKDLSSDMEVLISPGGRFSLRSVPPISHLIAREFNGGGHPNAAGGSFDFSLWEKFLFWLRGKNSKFDRFVKIAESIE
ncbi:oligoribonuclease NrnB/cAMP/cGMP phosphodiesterase (DHH superfamily) [Methanolinea mesophila]|uniref:DHH family phosphoesterase n=1 Tax=Methanolinea mesophila TaxID=547055 RepID=UPI00315893E9|nr:oligoribonuclease NrnB/cAMP/cGMP phosphodiesterase (DHH superfamily) [Methanolinea mesophila]